MKERLLIFAIVMLLVVIVFLLLAESTQAPDEVEPGGVLPGPPWTGEGAQGISQTEAESFAEFPLFWLGPAFEGFNLQSILHTQYEPPPGIPARPRNEVTFIYGACRLHQGPGRQSCAVPLSIHVQPVCQVSPEEALVVAYRGPAEALRGGGLLLERSDAAMVWTGGSLIGVHTRPDALPGLLPEVLQQLKGMGANEAPARGPLLPPDFSACE